LRPLESIRRRRRVGRCWRRKGRDRHRRGQCLHRIRRDTFRLWWLLTFPHGPRLRACSVLVFRPKQPQL